MSNENEVPTACNCRIAMTLNKQSPLLDLMWNQISPNRNITRVELLCVNRFFYCEMRKDVAIAAQLILYNIMTHVIVA